MTERSSALIQMLWSYGDVLGDVERVLAQECQWLVEAEPSEVDDVLVTLEQLAAGHDLHLDAILPPVLHLLVQRQLRGTDPLSDAARNRLVSLYRNLDEPRQDRWRILQWLASSASRADLVTFVELLIGAPPADWRTAAAAFAPLFQRRRYDCTAIFPRLLEALQHIAVAAPILDLANYLKRRAVVTEHPATGRTRQLADLLETMVGRLSHLETDPEDQNVASRKMTQQVEDSVALVVSLCDTLALIGDHLAIGKLRRAMELKHRRIRTEAAAALARFGDRDGIDTLIAMAREPVVRLRVLADAEELGISGNIDPQFISPEARAEACVAVELSQAAYFGVTPHQIEPVDSRQLYWPGHEQPQDCYLFRYFYRWGKTRYSNIALAGPVVHTFVADLNDVPIDDIYAAYAGWHAEHPEFFEVEPAEWSSHQRAAAERMVRKLKETGYRSVQPRSICYFFGDPLLVATALYEETPGTAIVNPLSIEWQPARNPDHPIGPTEALYIVTGRRLLNTFN